MFHPMYGTWAQLRSMRAARPPLATKGARAATFNAGLDQADLLWQAAGSVGPVASPLLLFYGLAQAGRAICAAIIPGQKWEGAHSHGLRFQLHRPSGDSLLKLQQVHISMQGNGLIQQIGMILDSPVLAEPLSVAALMATFPGAGEFPHGSLEGRRPLRVYHQPETNKTGKSAIFRVGPVPQELITRKHVPPGPNNLEYWTYEDLATPDVDRWLTPYHRLSKLKGIESARHVQVADIIHPTEELSVALTYRDPCAPQWPYSARWARDFMDEVDPIDSQFPQGWVIPSVAGNGRAHHSLVRWWLSLYAFSMLARYYPNEWRHLLDVDTSEIAVPVEEFIALASYEVPQAVLAVMKSAYAVK